MKAVGVRGLLVASLGAWTALGLSACGGEEVEETPVARPLECSPDFSTPAADPLVSYLWDGSVSSLTLIEEDGRQGEIVAISDPEGGGKVARPTPIQAPEGCASERLVPLDTIVSGRIFGSLLVHGFARASDLRGAELATYDASAFVGVTFYVAQTSAPELGMTVEVNTASDTSVDISAGTCVASAVEECFDFYGHDFVVTNSFTRFDLCWEDLKKPAWASDDILYNIRPFDPKELLRMTYKTAPGGAPSKFYFTRLGLLKPGAVSSVSGYACTGVVEP